MQKVFECPYCGLSIKYNDINKHLKQVHELTIHLLDIQNGRKRKHLYKNSQIDKQTYLKEKEILDRDSFACPCCNNTENAHKGTYVCGVFKSKKLLSAIPEFKCYKCGKYFIFSSVLEYGPLKGKSGKEIINFPIKQLTKCLIRKEKIRENNSHITKSHLGYTSLDPFSSTISFHIISVTIVAGSQLDSRWHHRMQLVTTDRGIFIDCFPGEQYGRYSYAAPGYIWESKVGQQVTGVKIIDKIWLNKR